MSWLRVHRRRARRRPGQLRQLPSGQLPLKRQLGQLHSRLLLQLHVPSLHLPFHPGWRRQRPHVSWLRVHRRRVRRWPGQLRQLPSGRLPLGQLSHPQLHLQLLLRLHLEQRQ